ncbi:MAG: hypothetical protein P1V20_23810 [Verrucomicrobiales bacterium]|nr:hypothetical protein [Verrucomicrobiales bacterium]
MRIFLTIALVLFPVAASFGFMPNPDLLSINPAVAKAGDTIEISIKGTNLDEAETLRFSSPLITAKPVTAAPTEFNPKPELFSTKFTVTIPADIEPGVYEVRSLGYFGLSTARPFLVLPAGDNETVVSGSFTSKEKATDISVNSGVVGLLPSSNFQWHRFTAKEGQRIFANVWSERLDSKADVLMAIYDENGRELESDRHHYGRDPFTDFTVPKDGTYYVVLNDALHSGGRDYFYRLHLHSNPHIDFVFPPAGEPGKKSPFTFFGRNLPGGSLGENWKWKGKSLETVNHEIEVPKTVTIPVRFDPGLPRQGLLEGFYTGLPGAKNSNEVKIGFATAPVVLEKPAEEIQTITVPAEVSGRFDQPGDFDFYRFSAKKDQTYWIEAISYRMGTIADPVVILEKIATGKDGKETYTKVAENDDPPSYYGLDLLDDLNADSLDPELSFTPKEDGDYRITLLNQSAGGSIAHLYRLAVRYAKPDFNLIVGTELTKTINNDAYQNAPLLRRGGSMVYRVLAFRRDGFDGEIKVTISNLPEGVSADPLILSGDAKEGYLTVQASPEAKRWSGKVEITGEATIAEQSVVKTARAASIIWGKRVFAAASQVRTRLDMETVLSVMDTETEATRLLPAEDKVWEVALNDTLELPVKTVETGTRVGNLQVEVHGFPGLHRSPPNVSIKQGETSATIKITMKKSGNFDIKPGKYQFVLQGVGNAKYSRNPAAAERAKAELKRLNDLLARVAKEADEATRKSSEAALKKNIAAATAADKKAATAAKEGQIQFATYSLPISVVVTEKK